MNNIVLENNWNWLEHKINIKQLEESYSGVSLQERKQQKLWQL